MRVLVMKVFKGTASPNVSGDEWAKSLRYFLVGVWMRRSMHGSEITFHGVDDQEISLRLFNPPGLAEGFTEEDVKYGIYGENPPGPIGVIREDKLLAVGEKAPISEFEAKLARFIENDGYTGFLAEFPVAGGLEFKKVDGELHVGTTGPILSDANEVLKALWPEEKKSPRPRRK